MNDDVITAVLADDHAVVRAGLKAVLGTARGMRVVGEAANGAEAVGMVLRPE
jgi:DNA-binding NarL/FixJ family response regulator